MSDMLGCSCSGEPYYISAYGLAVKRGYTGTLDEWLEGLGMYLHVATCDHLPQPDEEVSYYPLSDYIGICATHSSTAPTTAGAYKWVCIKPREPNVEKIAPTWAAGTEYGPNDIVSYNGDIYIHDSTTETAAEFNPAHWTETTLAEALKTAGWVGAVRYDEAQSLTSTQKAQACGNIGAVKKNALDIVAADIANGAVTAAKLASGAVETAKIADGAVTAAKIADGTITGTQIAQGAIIGSKLASECIRNGNLQDGCVTGNRIANSTISGTKLNLAAGDLPVVTLVSGVHYFASASELPTNAAVGRIAFVKRG